LQIGLNPVAVCYNARQDDTIQNSTIKYNTITHITQSNIQHSRKTSVLKITTTKNPEHTVHY